MGRHPTAIVIVTAVVLAAIIVVATSVGRVVAERPASDHTAAAPTDHRIAPTDGRSGVVDLVVATREIRALERARVANPGSVRVTLAVGDAYLAARRYGDAEHAYRSALAASPGHPNAAVGLAAVSLARGDDERAVRLLERVLLDFPDHQRAQFDLARALFARQDLAGAREAWAKAAEIDPGSRLGRCAEDFVELLSDVATAL